MPTALAAAFLGMTVVFLTKTLADAAFLAALGVGYVPHLLVAQSLLAVATSFGYTAAIRRGKLRAADGAVLATTLALAATAPLSARAGDAMVFALALLLPTLAALASLVIWNAATGIATGRRARAAIPRLSAAASAGAVAGGFGASGVVAVVGLDALGPVAAVLVAVLAALRLDLGRRAAPRRASRSERAERRSTRHETGRLVTILIVAAVLEAVLAAVVDFGFKAEIDAAFDRREMGLVFAVFYGAQNVLILIAQLAVTARLLAAASLRTTLMLPPLVLLAACGGWAALPLLAFGALARGSESVMKFGVGRPAQEIALAPLRQRQRERVKILLRGVYAQGGAAAAGLALIPLAPLLTASARATPLVCVALAAVWLVVQRLVARRYLDTLGAAIGMRELSLAEHPRGAALGRDGIERLVALASGDGEGARTARELLANATCEAKILARHLAHPSPVVREILYRRLVAHPAPAHVGALARAALAEPDDSPALRSALAALGAARHEGAHARARALADAGDQAVCQAARAYLAETGAVDDEPERLAEILAELSRHDGVRAARIYEEALARELLAPDAVDAAIAAVIADGEAAARREGYAAAATLGRSRPLVELLRGIGDGTPGAAEAVVHLDGAALGRLIMLANARHAGPKLRSRLLRALRASELPEVVDVAVRALRDADPGVRDSATRTLLRHAREHGTAASLEVLDAALADELDRFEAYVRARPAYPDDARDSSIVFRHNSSIDAETFFLDELERTTEAGLSRLCGLLALVGNPEQVFIAERELRSPALRRRGKAVDILQEVVHGAHKKRMLQLLELFLQPPASGGETRALVSAVDPWLARCASDALGDVRHRLWALRATPIFDAVPGEALEKLARACTDVRAGKGELVVREGEPGDAMYAVLSGVLDVERGGRNIGRLGPGELFGELSLVDGAPRVASVRVRRSCELVRLPRGPFRDALAEHPEIRLGLIRALARWLRPRALASEPSLSGSGTGHPTVS